MIVLLTIFAGIAGFGCTYMIPERYTAAALVMVRPQQPIQQDERSVNKNLFDFPVTQSMSVETPAKTYIEIIKSQALIEKVVHTLDLDTLSDKKTAGFLARHLPPAIYDKVVTLKEDLAQLNKDALSFLMYGRTFPKDAFADAVKEVKDNISLKSLEDTFVFEIDYSGRNPQISASVANAMAQSFIDYMEQIRLSEARYVRDHMQTKFEQARQDLADARERLDSPKAARLSLRDLKLQELDVAAAQTAYESTQKDLKVAENNLAYPLPEVRLVSDAVPPHVPGSPIRIKIAAIALIGGLVAGIGFAFFLELINRRIRCIDDVEDFIGIRVLATIPRVSKRQWRAAGRQKPPAQSNAPAKIGGEVRV